MRRWINSFEAVKAGRAAYRAANPDADRVGSDVAVRAMEREATGKATSDTKPVPKTRSGAFALSTHFAIIASIAVAAGGQARAQGMGDLLVAPTRIVFAGALRTAELTLINTGQATATYRISFVHMRMSETGAMQEIGAPATGEQFADDLVRFSPRQVVLEPRVAQTVRLQVRIPEGLATGEYRSHLLFRALPESDGAPVGQDPNTTQGADAARGADPSQGQGAPGVGVQLKPIYGVSIPVIVRYGATTASVTLSDLTLERNAGRSVLSLRMERTRNASAYGDVTVTYTDPHGRSTEVGRVNGLAVYSPNPIRALSVPLALPANPGSGSGQLTAVYRQKPDDGGAVWAQATLRLP